ncbi:hypothetical protein EBR96_05445, partial [bacterium]|nr:hypothetical protein [bacterium]
AALLTRIHPDSFLLYNLFNLSCGLLGIFWIYWFSLKFWKDSKIAALAAVLASSSIVWVYLSRTPMYDWPAAIFFFGFCGYYGLYLTQNRRRWLWAALTCVGLGALNRFSIVIGLSGIFVVLTGLTYRRSIVLMIRDLIAVGLAGASLCAPWIYFQTMTHGHSFIHEFGYDNIGRYIREPGNAPIRRDYYGFTIYTIVGLIPHAFLLLATLFQRGIWARIKQEPYQWLLLAGFLPCLIAFSFSGHVKLARYISYVFPMLIMFMAFHLIRFDLSNPRYIRKASWMVGITAVLMGILLTIEVFHFPNEVRQSPIFVGAVIVLVMGLLSISWVAIARYSRVLHHHPHRILPAYTIVYLIFFSALAYEYPRVAFLKDVQGRMLNAIQAGADEALRHP